jgi:adenylosuccinate synthase
MSEPPVVLISGQVAAGKTLAGEMLRKSGFQYARISNAIKKLRWPPGREDKPPRSWYQQMGMELHRTIGQRALCAETLDFIDNPAAAFVIDGARWRDDVAFFREKFGERLVHIHLTANTDIRKRRFEERDKDISFEDADHDEVEKEAYELTDGADAVFENSTDDESRLKGFLNAVLPGLVDAD